MELASIRADTLLVLGEEDRLIPPDRRGVAGRLPGSRLVRLHCGQVLHVEGSAGARLLLARLPREELADDRREEGRPRKVRGLLLSGDDDEPTLQSRRCDLLLPSADRRTRPFLRAR